MQSLRVYFVAAKGDLCYALQAAVIPKEKWRRIYTLLQALRPYEETLEGLFVGAKLGVESPWSTTAREILLAIGVEEVRQIACFRQSNNYDPLLEARYEGLHGQLFSEKQLPVPTFPVHDLPTYNKQAALALSKKEVQILKKHTAALGRPLSDTEVFGWAQIHSEHCRHKLFNAQFVLDRKPCERSLFDWIKATTATHTNQVVSAYKDNVAFFSGPKVLGFSAEAAEKPSFFRLQSYESVLSLKAETHNFPTTVEPFYGAATGTGGEIRDRMAGGRGSLPLAGTAVYMTPYARLSNLQPWEKAVAARKWLYQRPEQLLIKASNGASDFANKFGQPLICGSLLTFEHYDSSTTKITAYDKVVMLAGGVGIAKASHAKKQRPRNGDLLLLLGGDNYRIGMGGGSVSSTTTGNQSKSKEQQAIQRANPEMQKRVADCLRNLLSYEPNPIRSIHDHGAGGHLNCFAELLEGVGGDIYLDALPRGDSSLSYTELLCNESQERIGLVIEKKDLSRVEAIAKREKCPLYVVGAVTETGQFRCIDRQNGQKPVDMPIEQLISQLPRQEIQASTKKTSTRPLHLQSDKLYAYTEAVLQLESVACKDWLTNKVDRCVGGRVAMQPCCGPLQLPLNNLGAVQLAYGDTRGLATSIGHAAVAGLLSASSGSRLSLAEALTNLVWAPLTYGLSGVSCSANWMWPQGKNEMARLYEAVSSLSRYASSLGINIPTGKDSLSMQQRYSSGEVVSAPGTLIISAAAEVSDLRQLISPVLRSGTASELLYVPLGKDFNLGGSALAQICSQLGDCPPEPLPGIAFAKVFSVIQDLIREEKVLAGHDIGSGGLLVSLLELCFASPGLGMRLDLSPLSREASLLQFLFSESPALLLQVSESSDCRDVLTKRGVAYSCLGSPRAAETAATLDIRHRSTFFSFDIASYRKIWFSRSSALDALQRSPSVATSREEQLGKQPLQYRFPSHFSGKWPKHPTKQRTATILREKGSNSDQEMAYALHRAGFKVQDMHTSDLTEGRDDLQQTDFLVFVGGFSHADVLGASRGWAATLKYNPYAARALEAFYEREDVLSLGVCNGCQLMGELGLLGSDSDSHPRLQPNESQYFECAFVALEVLESPSVLFSSLAGLRLGAWAAHGEGRFLLPNSEDFPLVARYAYANYPAHPNGSDLLAACLCSKEGRHNAIMPHIERALQPFHWGYYPFERKKTDEVSPWILPLVAAHDWLSGR